MKNQTQNEQLRELKKEFLEGTLGVCEPKFRKVVEGWERSRSAGVDPDCMKLTDEQRDLRVFDRIDDISKCHLAYFKDYYESRNTALDKLGGAIFYLDAQLVAFHKSGNEELLRTLKRRGIRIGTKFSVENVGVFAGNTAISRPFVTCYSSGEANYSRLFTDLVCIARYGETSAANGFHAVNLIFIPREKCNRNAFNSANFVLEAGDFTYKNRILYPHMERRFSLLEQSVQYTADIILLVDDSGDVTFVNSRFENEFGIPVTSIVGKCLRSKLPGLSFVLKALTSGKEIAAGNVQLSFGEEHSRFYYVECLPIREEQNIIGLKVVIKTAEQIRRYSAAAQRHNAVYNFQDIIAESSVMRRVKAAARAAACSPANVLITGESGTGKELFAQAIHNASPRFSGPFIPINCGGFTRDNAGSLLFGTPEKAGKLELADGGTLFLDDISEMSPEMQSFLLRFLDDGLITPANREESIHAVSYTHLDVYKRQAHKRGRAHHNRHEQGFAQVHKRGQFQGRFVLQAERHQPEYGAAEAEKRGHTRLGGLLSQAFRRKQQQAHEGHKHRGHDCHDGVRLAGKRARTAQRRGARRHSEQKRIY